MIALITGVTGFVGSSLCRRLVHNGWQVHGIVRPISNLEAIENVIRSIKVHVYEGGVEELDAITRSSKPDVVFHLASHFVAEHRAEDINPIIQTNILFGTYLLESMAQNSVRCLINTGTAWQHYQNEDYNPVCLYAASKKAFEAVLRYYQELFKIKAVTLKLHDTYGASDRRSKLFTTLRKHGENTVLPMSAGDQKLDLVYIDDVVDAYIVAAHRLLSRKNSDLEEFAVSSGNQVSLRDIVELYAQITKKKMRIDWGKRPYRLREVMVPWTKGSSLPGWEPKISLSEGIMRMHEHDRHSHMDERHSESFFREIY